MTGTVQHEVVIVAPAELELLIVLIDARANRGGLAKVERSPVDFAELAGGNQRGVDRCKAIGIDHYFVIENVAASLAGEVEVGMVG